MHRKAATIIAVTAALAGTCAPAASAQFKGWHPTQNGWKIGGAAKYTTMAPLITISQAGRYANLQENRDCVTYGPCSSTQWPIGSGTGVNAYGQVQWWEAATFWTHNYTREYNDVMGFGPGGGLLKHYLGRVN